MLYTVQMQDQVNLVSAFQQQHPEIGLPLEVFMAVIPFTSETNWNIGQTFQSGFPIFLLDEKGKLSNTFDMLMEMVFCEGSEGSPFSCCALRSLL